MAATRRPRSFRSRLAGAGGALTRRATRPSLWRDVKDLAINMAYAFGMAFTILHSRDSEVLAVDAPSARAAYQVALAYVQDRRPAVRIVGPDGKVRPFEEFEVALSRGEINDPS